MDLHLLETELKKRVAGYPYTPWGRKQADDWDRQTNFIYHTNRWETVLNITADMPAELRNYAINRWFNFWSAMGVETIFCNLPGVVAARDKKDRLTDFSINGVKFDHKTTVYPAAYPHSIDYARQHPTSLLMWLYGNQSQQKRFHLANRLFIVLYRRDGEHWKLRAELATIAAAIETYVRAFEINKLFGLNFNGRTAVADLIWIER
ncbi:MAG: hypothetical protein FOGNACKC_02211 [Anaerolineae bacterium]|nr:hypothetical protein [Anaerolineae bacterium]